MEASQFFSAIVKHTSESLVAFERFPDTMTEYKKKKVLFDIAVSINFNNPWSRVSPYTNVNLSSSFGDDK